ncbi:hypothetical protein ACO1O0_002859 [Amphichorda felina]
MSIRLIDTETLALKSFTGKFPKYAILSHTWVADEEVSFQEATAISDDPNHAATKKSGYRKIQRTCNKVKAHGFQYVWVDTCCIDKTSSAELSEAINSMYSWYASAARCYVYLEDLSGLDTGVESLGRCRWFTRGWTLQELIAPKELRFYNGQFKYVGTKRELKKTISKITGIHEYVLGGDVLPSEVAVARRMSWAAKRETTRAEDMAYCLLGIFDINMPMLYGEGKKAFMRLQEEIIKRSNDLSIFWIDPPKTRKVKPGSMYSIYEDLFARSPEQFASYDGDFRSLQAGNRHVFDVTSMGLHCKQVELHVHPPDQIPLTHLSSNGQGVYSLVLGHVEDSGDRFEAVEHHLFLQKLGPPGIFVKLCADTSMAHIRSDRRSPLRTSLEEAYITTSSDYELSVELFRAPNIFIKFVLDNGEELTSALQNPVPRSNWDAPNFQFVTPGELKFHGSVKIFPHLVQGKAQFRKGKTVVDNFHVACGTEPHPDSGEQKKGGRVFWVRLFSQKHWQENERKFGEHMLRLTSPNMVKAAKGDIDCETDELQVGDVTIRAETEHIKQSRDVLYVVMLSFTA